MSWRIGQPFGIGIFVHWTFLLLPAWILLTSAGASHVELAFQFGLLAAGFGCVVLHELGHALTARQFGIGTRDITLYPIGGVARLEKMTDKPWEEFWIAVAGPAVNVAIAALLWVGLTASTLLANPGFESQTLLGKFLSLLMLVNVWLVLFNLLPAFPMDGGRVLRALLAVPLGPVKATRIAAGLGVVMAIAIGLGGWYLTQSPFFLAIGFFIYVAGQQELQFVEMRQRHRWEEPIEVLPVRSVPDLPSSSLARGPHMTVFTWDNRTGAWVREEQPPPRQSAWRAWD